MIDCGVVEDEQMDWDHLLENIPDYLNFDFLDEPVEELSQSLNPSPDSGSLSIEDVEQLLMNDDSIQVQLEQEQVYVDGFFMEVLLDSPAGSDLSDEVIDIDVPEGKDTSSPSSLEEHKDKDKEAQVIPAEALQLEHNDAEDGDDPIAKKRKRQMRNRDAAVRSRERKKMYVKDLEMKSRYFEAECKRLGVLLQSCLAENQALRLSWHNSKAGDASMTKQESAVLLLESLLLGSLLWFLGITCLLILPLQLQLSVEAVLLDDIDRKGRGNVILRKGRSKILGTLEFQLSGMGRRCKASRARMKPSLSAPEVL